jgi:pseudouridine-5'-phosphate glycosidase
VVVAQPLPAEAELPVNELTDALSRAESAAVESGMRGKELTPFLLSQLAALTEGKTVRANQVLVVENARLAARIACAAQMNPGAGTSTR